MVRRTARALLLAASLILFPVLGYASEPLVTAAGMGANYLNYVNDEKSSRAGVDQEQRIQFASVGVFLFVDLVRYFTLYLGYRVPVGSAQATFSAPGVEQSQTADYGIGLLDVGAEARYPFRLSSWFTAAPKVGLESVTYFTGKVDNKYPDDDTKQYVSPILLSVGADLDFGVTTDVFVRIPIDVGIGLNSRLSDYHYSHNSKTNVSTSIVSGKIGCMVGYAY